jgi:ribosome-associated protein
VAKKGQRTADGTTFGDETLNSRQKAILAAREADELKARDIVILDVRTFPALAEYFVICTGETKRHLRGIADRLEEAADENSVAVHHAEGYGIARWILMDLNNVVVHIFDPETRDYYELERLWGDAPQIPYEPAKT